MKIEIKIECDCETEFNVKLPDCCYEPNNKHPFVLHCPYCQGAINHNFHIEKIIDAKKEL